MTATDLRRRASFDENSDLYARSRPGYPGEAFDLILDYAGLGPGARALEIGCGPGQATLPMARRGLSIVAVEIGPRMAELAASRTSAHDVTIANCAFEDWPLPSEPFDIVYSASAFHWISPAIRYTRTAAALRTGGTLALFWNRQVQDRGDEGFDAAAQRIYEAVAPELSRRFTEPSSGPHRAEWLAEIAASGLFEDLNGRVVPWANEFTPHEYADLLSTYSDHATLPPDTLRRLLDAVRDLIDSSFGGLLRRRWATIVYLARKAPAR
jgi:SAM-dependent methyltransferase